MRPIDADALKRKEQQIATQAWKLKVKASVETILNQFIDDIEHSPTVDAVPREIEQANKQAAYVRGYEDGQKDKYGRWMDAVPVAYSEWIPKEKADTPYGLEMECANCGFSVIVNDALYFKFCPNCGARMDGEQNG